MLENHNNGRPVLVILDSPKHILKFVSYIISDLYLTIKGINKAEDITTIKFSIKVIVYQ